MPEFSLLKVPKPVEFTVKNTEIGDVTITYDRHAMVPAVTSLNTYIRERLARSLLGWNVTIDGEPMQPPSIDDEDKWADVVIKGRTLAHEQWEARKSQHDALEPKARKDLEPLGDEPVVDAPVTAIQRRDAYVAAWAAILREVSTDFLREIDGGLLDHFLEVAPSKTK